MKTTETVQELNKLNIENGQYDLVKGDFTPEDASEILNHMLNKKINFHQCRNFGQIIRLGESDEKSEIRIEELKSCQESINEIIKNAESIGKNVRIKTEISIELI